MKLIKRESVSLGPSTIEDSELNQYLAPSCRKFVYWYHFDGLCEGTGIGISIYEPNPVKYGQKYGVKYIGHCSCAGPLDDLIHTEVPCHTKEQLCREVADQFGFNNEGEKVILEWIEKNL